MGAWIETKEDALRQLSFMSHPVWVRGLKHSIDHVICNDLSVAPRVGAWIETLDYDYDLVLGLGRTPCGCVD